MIQSKVSQIGNSLGVILPKEILARLKIDKGDAIFIAETPGGIVLTPYDEKIEQQLRLGRELMSEYRETFRELAK